MTKAERKIQRQIVAQIRRATLTPQERVLRRARLRRQGGIGTNRFTSASYQKVMASLKK